MCSKNFMVKIYLPGLICMCARLFSCTFKLIFQHYCDLAFLNIIAYIETISGLLEYTFNY